MTISKEIEARILRYHFVEQWRVGMIATQLSIHHGVVDRVLAEAGLPKVERSPRPSIIDPYLPFIVETLREFPTLTAARLYEMAKQRGYPGGPSQFLALYFMTQSKTNISVLSLKRHMGVSYPTAWLVKHKLMQTMAEREDRRQLTGRVVADDAYLGGVTTGGKRGRGAEKSGLFMAAVEVDKDSAVRYARFDRLPGLNGNSIQHNLLLA